MYATCQPLAAGHAAGHAGRTLGVQRGGVRALEVRSVHGGHVGAGDRRPDGVALVLGHDGHVAGHHGRHRHVAVVVLHAHDALVELGDGLEVCRHARVAAPEEPLQHSLIEAPPQLVQLTR